MFLKIRGDIHSSRCTTGVIDTGGKWKKSSIIKVFIILFGHLWEVELAYRYIFAFKFTLRSQQPDIVPIITQVANLPRVSLKPVANCHRCCWHWRQICCRYRWQVFHWYQQHWWNWWQNLLLGSLIPVTKLPPVSLILAVHLDLRISLQIFKKFETVLTGYSGAGGNWFMKKPEAKNLVTLSL